MENMIVNLGLLRSCKNDIILALNNKGINVSDETSWTGLASEVNKIQVMDNEMAEAMNEYQDLIRELNNLKFVLYTKFGIETEDRTWSQIADDIEHLELEAGGGGSEDVDYSTYPKITKNQIYTVTSDNGNQYIFIDYACWVLPKNSKEYKMIYSNHTTIPVRHICYDNKLFISNYTTTVEIDDINFSYKTISGATGITFSNIYKCPFNDSYYITTGDYNKGLYKYTNGTAKVLINNEYNFNKLVFNEKNHNIIVAGGNKYTATIIDENDKVTVIKTYTYATNPKDIVCQGDYVLITYTNATDIYNITDSTLTSNTNLANMWAFKCENGYIYFNSRDTSNALKYKFNDGIVSTWNGLFTGHYNISNLIYDNGYLYYCYGGVVYRIPENGTASGYMNVVNCPHTTQKCNNGRIIIFPSSSVKDYVYDILTKEKIYDILDTYSSTNNIWTNKDKNKKIDLDTGNVVDYRDKYKYLSII